MKIHLNDPLTANKKIQTFLNDFTQKHNLAPTVLADIDLALGELLNNILNYAYKQKPVIFISLECELKNNCIYGTLIDSGSDFNPLTHDSLNQTDMSLEDRPIGGLGLVIVKKIFSSLNYKREEEKNYLNFHMPL